MYIDNNIQGTTGTGIINDSTNKMVIGQYGEFPSLPFNGSIGGCFFFKGSSLDLNERTKLYSNGFFFKHPFKTTNFFKLM